jgi:hypothetical protein
MSYSSHFGLHFVTIHHIEKILIRRKKSTNEEDRITSACELGGGTPSSCPSSNLIRHTQTKSVLNIKK